MLTLYHCPFTRSHLIRFALEELELPHTLALVDVRSAEHNLFFWQAGAQRR